MNDRQYVPDLRRECQRLRRLVSTKKAAWMQAIRLEDIEKRQEEYIAAVNNLRDKQRELREAERKIQ